MELSVLTKIVTNKNKNSTVQLMFFRKVAFGEADNFIWGRTVIWMGGKYLCHKKDHDIHVVLSLTCLKTLLLLGLKLSKDFLLSGVKFCRVLHSITYINGYNYNVESINFK